MAFFQPEFSKIPSHGKYEISNLGEGPTFPGWIFHWILSIFQLRKIEKSNLGNQKFFPVYSLETIKHNKFFSSFSYLKERMKNSAQNDIYALTLPFRLDLDASK